MRYKHAMKKKTFSFSRYAGQVRRRCGFSTARIDARPACVRSRDGKPFHAPAVAYNNDGNSDAITTIIISIDATTVWWREEEKKKNKVQQQHDIIVRGYTAVDGNGGLDLP